MQIADDAFYQVSNLVELDVSNNFLTIVPTKSLENCSILRKLYLSHNPIANLTNFTFRGLVHLQTLVLSDAAIETVDTNAFAGLKSLRYLHLNGNKLR